MTRTPVAIVVVAATFVFVAGSPGQDYTDVERSHWSLQPRTKPAVPRFTDASSREWLRAPVDAFILERLHKAGLQPSPVASREVLIRRLYIDLTGLPPSPEDITDFLADTSPDAYEQLVDRILASPHYGEQWGQHWLDVVRFAETEGFEYDRHRAGAWRYRDYVIDSLNEDKAFDRFALEQLAGDELNEQTEATRVAAGFYRLGPVRRNAGNTDVAFSRNEVLTEMTDSIGFVFLGLTLGCARCHDHMFDAIRQQDYYQLQAFLAATQEHDIQLGPEAEVKAWNALNSQVQEEIKRIREALNDSAGDDREKLVEQLREAEKRVPPPLPTISSVHDDQARRTMIRVLERGQTDHPKQEVAPRVLGVLLDDSATAYAIDVSQPKLKLAQWITDPQHPLTSRVIANRLWQFHFGRGLVDTPNDFGVNGATPSHPELLDYLANELVAHQWQLKSIHRLILASATYRQSSESVGKSRAQEIDPNNRLLWRFHRRRLTAEQLRDAMLTISGRLNSKFGGPSIMPPVRQELVDLLYAPDQWQVTAERREHDRRSIYLIAKRNLRLPYLEVFDQPDLQISCSRRESSTHAPQALELLNGDLSNDLAAAFAERLVREVGDDQGCQVQRAFELTVGRRPTAAEQATSLEFLANTHSLKEFALAMLNVNAFLYVE